MDIKKVLEEQIQVLQKLQDENMSGVAKVEHKIDGAVKLAEQIRILCEDARRL